MSKEPEIDVSKLDPKIIAKILQAKEDLKTLESTAIIFVYGNPTPIFTRNYNAEKQAIMELTFSEKYVENPEVRRQKLRDYVC